MEVQLLSHQIEHYNKIKNIIEKSHFYIDGSETGSGKTYVCAKLAQELKLGVIVVSPKPAKQTWIDVFKKFEIPMIPIKDNQSVITYESLASKKNKPIKHILLKREDKSGGIIYQTTQEFDELVKKGILLIFDEAQKLKNANSINKAVKCLTTRIKELKVKSKVGFLSGTILDKQEQTANFMKMVGIITHKNLYSKINTRIRYEGINELFDWALQYYDEQVIDQWILSNPFKSNKKGSQEYIFKFFNEIITPKVMSIMTLPKMDAIKDTKNGFYELTGHYYDEYSNAVKMLSNAIRYNDDDDKNINRESFGSLTGILMKIQEAKMYDMVRIAKKELKSNPNVKVILFADYYNVIDYLLENLYKYKPLELTGRVKAEQQTKNKNLFQEQNTEHRLLIGNCIIGSLTHNLHDITGKYPRVMYIMPNYKINELHQATGRIYRTNTVGIAKIRFFYGDAHIKEHRILNALSRKGEIMREILKEQHDAGVKFFDEYENEYEIEDK